MAVKIACPKCQALYQLPESAIGKGVKCKKCGTKFAAQPVGQAKAGTKSGAKAAAKPRAKAAAGVVSVEQPELLAKFGISSDLKKPPGIFDAPPPPKNADPLGVVITDPGFDMEATVDAPIQEVDAGDASMAAILNNPFAKEKTHGSVEANKIVDGKKKKKGFMSGLFGASKKKKHK